MTYEEISLMMAEMNLPYAYFQFPNGTETEPPFLCFYYSQNDPFYADDKNYVKREVLVIELYTRDKDFAAEAAVEAVLSAHELPFTRIESYIETEKLILETYECEVLING